MPEDNIRTILRVIERLPVPALIANPVTAEILWANTRIVKMAAAKGPDQIVGRSLFDFIEAPQMSRALLDLAKVVLKQSPPPVTYQLRKFTGEYAAAQVASMPMMYGGQLAMLSIVTDVSERERLIRELEESEQRHRLLLENSPTGIFVVSEDRIAYANSSATTALGFRAPQTLLGRHLSEFIEQASQADMKRLTKAALMNGSTEVLGEVSFVCADGSSFIARVTMARIRWDGEPAVQTLISEIVRSES